MIDLCLCVPGQIVKYRNDAFGTYAGSDNNGDTYQFHTRTKYGNLQSHTRFGWISKSGVRHPYDVVEILPLETPEEKPLIDLSTCVPDQKVRFANGKTGEVGGSTTQFGLSKMRTIQANDFGWCWYTLDGKDTDELGPEWEIVEILPLEIPEEEPMTTPQEMDYKTAYLDIAMTVSVAFPECEVTTVDMVKLIMNENRTLRMALGLPSYKQVSDAIDDEQME